jgi:hypothetical protein
MHEAGFSSVIERGEVYSEFQMKNILKDCGKRQGITMVQRLSILVENRSQRWEPLSAVLRQANGWRSERLSCSY